MVSEDGRHATGILSERDIVREIGRRGAGCLAEPVAALMTREIVTCARGDSADGVLVAMTEGRFRHLPVVEAGELVGLISIGDVVKARLAELGAERDALEGMIKGFVLFCNGFALDSQPWVTMVTDACMPLPGNRQRVTIKGEALACKGKALDQALCC